MVGYKRPQIEKNIQNLENVLNQVMLLKPARYQMIDSNPNATESIGFVAQELKEVFPELVDIRLTPTKNGAVSNIPDLHGINYSHLSAVAIKAIQEQQELIQNLQKQNEELVQLYTQLVKDVEALKKRP